ncbi:DUF3445 domain-containing protein [Bacillus haimaensis]|uniref:heme-dependent oxidative N-demethylase family protein n=1 Tax=Bacillus haimaensis TaxID=3160967 RepID=UPI003AA94DB1
MEVYNNRENFPYPFKGKSFRYTNNSILLDPPSSIDCTDHYEREVQIKRKLLEEHPERCYQSLPTTMEAQWEAFALVADNLATYFPEKFSLLKKGKEWCFSNKVLNEQHSFIFGDASSLPVEPLDFIGRHVQEDLILMIQKDRELFLDAGQLCFPANWSLAFNLGMSFKELHHPIPGFKDNDLVDRIQAFILKIEDGAPWVRTNWQMMAGNRLDTPLETFHDWGQARRQVTKDNVGELVHLRVEVQKLFRLPRTHSILFSIHTHLLSLEAFSGNVEWAKQFSSILAELPSYIYEYKGIALYREAVIDYLNERVRE